MGWRGFTSLVLPDAADVRKPGVADVHGPDVVDVRKTDVSDVREPNFADSDSAILPKLLLIRWFAD